MESTARSKRNKLKLERELLDYCQSKDFEVHHGAPPFWNDHLDLKMEKYLQQLPQHTYCTCPHCGFQLKAPQVPEHFESAWWIYPQKAFTNVDVCPHFEALTFSILWTNSEPMGPPWTIPCGWGVPALNDLVAQSDNFSITVKPQQTSTGATIYWIGIFKEYPAFPSINDYWAIPILKSAVALKHSLNSRGYWGEYQPLSIHSPVVWNRLYLESSDGKLTTYGDHKDTGLWLNRIRSWLHSSYTQPLKMQKHRFISESGLASFALGMRSSRLRGALFISQTPIFQIWPHESSNLQHQKEPPMGQTLGAHIQSVNLTTMRGFAETGALWILIDPFQNEMAQDWLRLIQKTTDAELLPLWRESEIKNQWYLTADSSVSSSLSEDDLVNFYRDLSPLLINVNPKILELSLNYPLERISWGAFFLSSDAEETIHAFLRQKLVCYFQQQWIYFRFYEPHFLSLALSVLPPSEIDNFLGPITAWILTKPSEYNYTLYTSTERRSSFSLSKDFQRISVLSPKLHEVAQKVFQFDQPYRLKSFIYEKTPDFAELVPEGVMNRWIRESVNEALHFNIAKEGNVIKYFLWKVLITPTWCHLPPFQKILHQNVAEEIKIQRIENLLPQLRLSELPRQLTIEAWDPQLWNQLKEIDSPLSQADPESFHPLLGEHPPSMPLQQPNWLRALGLFYENAYQELQAQSGMALLDDIFQSEMKRPLYAPPRLVSISKTNIIVRDEGQRAHSWLSKHGFENLHSTGGNWIFRSNNENNLLLVARNFLEEFPYLESQSLLDGLSEERKKGLCFNLDLLMVSWDTHQFWQLKALKTAA